MDLDSVMTKLNPLMVSLLESRCHGLLSRGLMVIHVQGVRSGVRYKIPVGYQRKEELLWVLVSKAPRKKWWRNYRSENAVAMTVRGERISGIASLVDKESDKFKEVVSLTFARVPGLSRQFGIKGVSANQLSDEQWDVVKSEAELVEVCCGA